MKSKSMFSYILGSAVFISQVASGFTLEASSQPPLTSQEVEQYTRDAAEHAYKAALAILSIPYKQQTFENILRPWNELSAQLSQNFTLLSAIAESHSSSSAAASQAIQDLRVFLKEITQDPKLCQILTSCAEQVSNDDHLNPIQRSIADGLLQNGAHESIYLHGSFQEKNNTETDFTVLHLDPTSFSREQMSDLAGTVLSANADVVSIRETFVGDKAYDLYQILQNNYAHFIYLNPYTTSLDLSEHDHVGGLLIASKYPLEKVQFNSFEMDQSKPIEGFFDFIVKNADRSLGHIYAANLQQDSFDETQHLKFVQILEKMQTDFLNTEESSAPFFLCGDLSALKYSQESKNLIDAYFHNTPNLGTTTALLLQALPAFPNEYTLSATSIPMLDNQSGLLIAVNKANLYSLDHVLKNLEGTYWNENYIILCKGRADVSTSSDTDGNSSIEARVNTSTQTENGDTFSAEVRGGVYQDKDGNTSGRVEASATWGW